MQRTGSFEDALLRVRAAAAGSCFSIPDERSVARAFARRIGRTNAFTTIGQIPRQGRGHRSFNQATFGNTGFAQTFTFCGAIREAVILRKARGQARSADSLLAASGSIALAAVLATVFANPAAGSAVLPIAHRVTARRARTSGTTRRAASAASAACTRRAAPRACCAPAVTGRAPADSRCAASTHGASSRAAAAPRNSRRASHRLGARTALTTRFDADLAPALETRVAATAPAGASLGSGGTAVATSRRLGTTRTDQQRDRQSNNPPRQPQHLVLAQPRASHARSARASSGPPTLRQEALP